jgi:multiple sugar transport system permease protein
MIPWRLLGKDPPKGLHNVFITTFLLLLFPLFGAAADQELVFWNFWDPKFILPVIDEFERNHPGIRIRNEQLNWGNGLDKIVIALADHRGPDICELGSTWTGKFMTGDVLADLTEHLKEFRDEYLMWAPAEKSGRIIGLPWLVGTRVLFFNRQLFRSAGLDPNSPPQTWAELLLAARRIHRPEEGIFGFGINAGEGHILYKKVFPFIWGAGGKILDESGIWAFDSPATRSALHLFRDLSECGLREKQDILDEAFKKGKLGMEVSGSWNFARFPREAPDLDFGVTLIPRPAPEKGESRSFLGGQVLVVFRHCPNVAAAARFIRHLTLARNTLPISREALVSFPAHKAAYHDPFFSSDPRFSVFLEQMKTAVHPPVHPLWIEMERIINNTLERVMHGGDIDVQMLAAHDEFERVQSRFDHRMAQRKGSEPRPVPSPPRFPFSGKWSALLGLFGVFLSIWWCFRRQQPRSHGRTIGHAFLLLSPWGVVFAVFWLYPLIFSFILGFCDFDVFHPETLRFIGLENFRRLVGDPHFRQAVGNTLVFTLFTTPITTLLALGLAFITDKLRLPVFFRSAFFLPSIVSLVVIAGIFKSFYAPDGLVNTLVAMLGFLRRGWLVEPAFALPAIMIMNIWASIGYYMVLFLAALKAIPIQLYEAAEMDGAGEWGKFRYVTLPHLRPMILFVVVINTIRGWQVFPEVFTLTHGGPLGTTDTLVHRLYETAFRFHEMGYASAMGYVLFFIVLSLTVFQTKIIRGFRAGI